MINSFAVRSVLRVQLADRISRFEVHSWCLNCRVHDYLGAVKRKISVERNYVELKISDYTSSIVIRVGKHKRRENWWTKVDLDESETVATIEPKKKFVLLRFLFIRPWRRWATRVILIVLRLQMSIHSFSPCSMALIELHFWSLYWWPCRNVAYREEFSFIAGWF